MYTGPGMEVVQSANAGDRGGEGGRHQGSRHVRIVLLAGYRKEMNAGVQGSLDLRLAAEERQMTAGRRNLPHRETARLEPIRYRRKRLVRGAESGAVLRGGQPLVVLRRFRILLGGEKLLKCVLLLGSLGKDDIETLRPQRCGRLAGIELRSGKLVDVAGQRDEIRVRDRGADSGQRDGRRSRHDQAAQRISKICSHLLAPVYVNIRRHCRVKASRQSLGFIAGKRPFRP